jgi:K+-transporting ATPase ATPase C chain
MNAHLRANLLLVGGTLLAASVLYPLAVYTVGWVAFRDKSTGSIVRGDDGKALGSELIAQEFKGDEFFQPRPSATTPSYNASASSGSNWGANNPKLRDRVARQLGPIVKYRDGKPVGPDVEAWSREKPARLAAWARRYPALASAWLTGDDATKEAVAKWREEHDKQLAAWKEGHPDDSDDVAFFAVFAAEKPAAVPGVAEKKIQPVAEGSDVQGWYFDWWLQEHAEKAATIEAVPADMVTASGSGLDPHITLRNARYQIDRVVDGWVTKKKLDPEKDRARVEKIRDEVRALVNDPKQSFVPLSGLAGEPLVNVLELNRALAARMDPL